MDVDTEGELRRNRFLIDKQREQLSRLDVQTFALKQELKALERAMEHLLHQTPRRIA
jgi:hypothetical protein